MLTALRFIATHPLSARRPLPALARYAWWQINSRLRDEIEFDWIDGAKLVARNGMTVATGNIYCGLHEFEDMAFVMHLLRPGDLFADVGANVGSYTVLASRVSCARTVAFEPDPASAAALLRNVAANSIGENVRIVEAAADEATGIIRFSSGLDTMNRVVDAETSFARELPAVRLDDEFTEEAPLCMKLDVEGHEPSALAGAAVTLTNPQLKAVLVETVDADVLERLTDVGFAEYVYSPFLRELMSTERGGMRAAGNRLFLRNADFCAARVAEAPTRTVAGLAI